MKTTSILGFCSLFAGLVAAAPLDKREYAYVTVTSEVVEVVDVTVTITVEPTPHAYSWSWSHQGQTTTTTTSSSSSTTSSSSSSASSSQVAAQTAEETRPEDSYVPATTAPEAPAATEEATEEEPAQEQPNTYAPTTTPAPQSTTSSTTQQPSATPTEESQPTEYGQTSTGETYSGELTFYDTGLGACGWTNDGTVENVVALPHGFMGQQSNGNPYCGRMIEVHHDGKSVQAKVVDKCMGCEGMSIDLSRAAFSQLAHFDEGRIKDGCTWNFVD